MHWSYHSLAISMAQHKTAVTPLLTHWSYCSPALSHRFVNVCNDFSLQCFLCLEYVSVVVLQWTSTPDIYSEQLLPTYWIYVHSAWMRGCGGLTALLWTIQHCQLVWAWECYRETHFHTCGTVVCLFHISRDQPRYAPSQWGMSLHCNDISHWLGAYQDWCIHSWLVCEMCVRRNQHIQNTMFSWFPKFCTFRLYRI